MSGRRAAGRATECSLWLPADSGVVADGREDQEERRTEVRRGEAEAGTAEWAGGGHGPEAA